jgi:CBS domain-containing protein
MDMKPSNVDVAWQDDSRLEKRRLPIVTRTVVGPDLAFERTLQVFCPMHERTVALESCVECPFCAAFDAADDRPPSVACKFETVSGRPALTLGSVLARSALCVRADALGEVGHALAAFGVVPIVNERTQLVGVLDATNRTTHPLSHGRLATEHALGEGASISEALATMARRRIRQLIVVAADGTVLGIVEDLALLRALKEGMREVPR